MEQNYKESKLMEIILKRKSVRGYSEKPVEEWKLFEIIEAARLAPSASNSQPCRYIIIENKTLIEDICNKALGKIVPNKWLITSPVIICIVNHFKLVTNRIGEKISGISYHQVDTGIAGEHLVLRATELGLGTCWIGWFMEKRLRKLLKISSSDKIMALISVGYPKEDKNLEPKKHSRLPIDEIMYRNYYGEKWDETK